MRWIRGSLLFLCVLAAQIGVAATVRLVGNTLYVNESPVMILRYGNAETRTRLMVNTLSAASSADKIRAVQRGNRALILVNDKSVFRVEPQDAKAAKMTAIALAKSWVSNINRALTMPPLVVPTQPISLGVNGATKLPLSGRLASSAAVEIDNDSVAKVKRVGNVVEVKAQGPGSGTIIVSAGGIFKSIPIRVSPVAAVFPQYATVHVTGFPCTSSIATGAVENAIWNQTKYFPNASLKFTVDDVGQLKEGESRTVMVRVKATAPEALESEGVVHVTVRNSPIQVAPESELWYCNFPEKIEKLHQLFGARLKQGSPARMLYHHINEMGQGLIFHAQLVNQSDRTARVLVIPGDCSRDKNPVLAGIETADRFLRNWLNSSGEIITIPPKMTMPISFCRLAPNETVSGLVYLNLLDGGPESVLVRADSKPTFNPDERWLRGLASEAPWRVLGTVPARKDEVISSQLTEHIYPEPFKKMDVSYQVGGRHGFVRIGQQPIRSSNGDNYLDGNFGVLYTIQAQLDNPSAGAANVEIVFEASAGYAGALFAYNGQVLRTPLLHPKRESRILRIRLEPGASRNLTLRTIPLSGGSYPATLSVRTIDATLGSGNTTEALFPGE